ncbi:protein involved in polysaccharide export with SLBB domain [Rubrivivax gelatinosus]|uniref:SLBB domain-containing protein n=1 Tax=Rubrivivax gelatinosus TaxID=28068 RepID=UPI001A30E38D|nr:SLBB domain-containing protein [Rubrivivax gelatinosus]MBG6079380.1 protein involved in polysaccharide export with SLBB domain [Rubrivivax gelatinosus]
MIATQAYSQPSRIIRPPNMHCVDSMSRLRRKFVAICFGLSAAFAACAQDSGSTQVDTAPAGSSIRLRQQNPTQQQQQQQDRRQQPSATATAEDKDNALPLRRLPPPVSEFERYARKATNEPDLRRFGYDLVERLQEDRSADYNPSIPADYLVRVGDELVVTLWGSVDADLRLMVDRGGRISIPRVGPVLVSGVRYADLPDVISRRVSQVFRNFQVSVALGQLRGMRVYVTGFADSPGPVVVNSLSTMSQALLAAGGPAASGSFRNIVLRRGKTVVAQFDLYDLLLKGDRSADQILQPDDVIHIGPIGPQVAVVGSVNRHAIFEIKRGETVDDALQMAGSFTSVADMNRIALDRLGNGNANRLLQLSLPESTAMPLVNGDILRAFNAGDLERPAGTQQKRVRVEGEVAHPGEYVMPVTSTVADAVRAAGGLTANGYLYATEFMRESVRRTQQQNYERALRDLEADINTQAATRRATTAEEANGIVATTTVTKRWLDQLRELKPTGRLVLNISPASTELPDLMLEDGDRIFVPARPTTIGVFGSVFSAGSYLYSPSRNVGDYLRLAGGPKKGADQSSVFVVRANGTVASSLQEAGWFTRGNALASTGVQPGDTIFVPEEMDKTTWIQNAKDWTQLLYQFGIGLAGIKSATN